MVAASELEGASARLRGVRVLVVEDDFFIGLELMSILSDAGAIVVGPANTVQAALLSAEDEGLAAAILDIRLGAETVAPVARRLAAHHVPFVFYTGQTKADPVQAEWPDCRSLSKPTSPDLIVKAVAALLERQPSTAARH